MERLTGRTRHRVGLFNQLILQIEVAFYDDMPHGGMGRVKWRDARAEDLLTVDFDGTVMVSEIGGLRKSHGENKPTGLGDYHG